jgi:hypothetical protein
VIEAVSMSKMPAIFHETKKPEGKAVPLHAVKALGEKGIYLLLIPDFGTRWR